MVSSQSCWWCWSLWFEQRNSENYEYAATWWVINSYCFSVFLLIFSPYVSTTDMSLTWAGLLQLPAQIRPIPSQPPHVAPPQAEAGWPNLCPINWFTMRSSPPPSPTLELRYSQPAAPPHLVVQRPSCMCVYVSVCAHVCRQGHFSSSCPQCLERVFQHLSFKKTYIIISISFSNIQHYICESDEEPTDWMDKMFFAIRANTYI